MAVPDSHHARWWRSRDTAREIRLMRGNLGAPTANSRRAELAVPRPVTGPARRPADARICRIADVVFSHIYALLSMPQFKIGPD
jgi:hypothetical protein